MADAILMAGGTGGVTSDDVTAKKVHVLQGYKTVTNDSNDEPIEGTMENRGYHGPDSSECWLYPAEGGYVIRLEEGFYHKDESGYKPYVITPTALVKNAVGYKPDKTLSDTVTCGEQGQIKIIDTGANNFKFNMSNSYGIDYGRGTFFIDFAHGTAYYTRGDGHPHVCIPADALGDADASSVLVGRTATSKNGVKFIGTMPDYRVGRPVFEFATFDQIHVSGVADKDFPQAGIMRTRMYGGVISNYVRYAGIKDGGICIEVNAGGGTELHMGNEYSGIVLDRAILMNFFRYIKVTYVIDLRMRTGNFQRRAGVNVEIGIYNAANKIRIGKSAATHASQNSAGATEHVLSTQELIIDTSGIAGDMFLAVYANAFSDFNQSYVQGKIVFTKIELIN